MLHRAVQETGQHERDGHQVSSRVAAYLQAGGIALATPESPAPYWGGAFMAWVAIKDGLTPPINPSDPESWRDWGHPLADAVPGAIVVLTDGVGRSQLRVGIVARVAPGRLFVVGCHDGVVGLRPYAVQQVIEVRRPPASQMPAAIAPTTGTAHSVDINVNINHSSSAAPTTPPLPDDRMITAPSWFDRGQPIEDVQTTEAPKQATPQPQPLPTPPLPAVFDDLLALRWKAIREIAEHADEIKQRWPETERLQFVASVAVMSADALHNASSRGEIEAARSRVIEVIRAN